jgi:hypothetical protein
MSLSFSRVVSNDPYVVELFHGDNKIHVHAPWFEGDDYSRDRIETAILRFPDAKSFGYWLEWFDLSLTTIAAETLAADLPPLTESDRLILAKMLEHGVNHESPRSQAEIIRITTGGIDTKGLFDNLKRSGLVDSKKNVGTWLTRKGIETAKRIKGI